MSLAIWGCWPVEIQYVYGQCSKPAEKICLKFQNFPELDWKRINCPFSTPATPAGPGWLQLAARLCKWRNELRRGAIWWPVQESPLFCSTTGDVPCSQMKAWEHQMYPVWIWEIPQEVRDCGSNTGHHGGGCHTGATSTRFMLFWITLLRTTEMRHERTENIIHPKYERLLDLVSNLSIKEVVLSDDWQRDLVLQFVRKDVIIFGLSCKSLESWKIWDQLHYFLFKEHSE